MTTYRQRIEKFLFNPYYMLSVFIIAVISFGFSITHTSVGIDDLESDRYFGADHMMIANGRFGRIFWNKLFENGVYTPSCAFAIDLIAVLLLIAAAMQFCLLLQRSSENRFTMTGCILFSCMFISYPLINEIWEYTEVNLDVCGGYLFIGLSVYAMYEVIHSQNLNGNKKTACILFSLFCSTIICSTYESLAAVYVLVVFTVLLLQTLYKPGEKSSWGNLFKEGIIYAAVFLGGVLLKLGFQRLLMFLFHPVPVSDDSMAVFWGTRPLKTILKELFFGLRYRFIDQAFWYFPMTVLLVCLIIFGCGLIVSSIMHRNFRRFLMGTGMMLSLILLALIQGTSSPNRICQTHAFFAAFTVLLVYGRIRKNKAVGVLFAAAMGILCIHQATFLNNIAAANYRRSEYEADIIKTIGQDLKRAGYDDKKIVFVGRIEIPESIMDAVTIKQDRLRLYNIYRSLLGQEPCGQIKYVETNVNSVLNWAIEAFLCDGLSVDKLFAYYGYNISYDADHDLGDEAQYYVMGTLENSVPKYPQDGYIIEYGDYVIVRLG